MPNGKSVGAEVTPEFNQRLERIQEDQAHRTKSETVRFLLHEGADQVDSQETFAQVMFKNAAIGLTMVALVGYLWAAVIADYSQPLFIGVVWMIPAVGFLWLHTLWPGITARFAGSADETANPSEA